MVGKLDTAWRSYAEMTMPVEAGTVQRQECRRAFYAGAKSFLNSIFEMEAGDEPTDEDLKMMDGLAAELDQFYLDVLDGKA